MCDLLWEERPEYDDYYGQSVAHYERERACTQACASSRKVLDLCQTDTQRRFLALWIQELGKPGMREPWYMPIATEPANSELLSSRLSQPALIPEVWLNYLGPRKTRQDEQHLSSNPSRVDFVLFHAGRKVVIEIDGPSHYADYDEARRRYTVSERLYTKNLRIERSLRANGWEIFRFSGLEVQEVEREQFSALTAHVVLG